MYLGNKEGQAQELKKLLPPTQAQLSAAREENERKTMVIEKLEREIHYMNREELKRSKHCQNGRSDICLAGSRDGVCCAENECDIDSGVRSA